MPQLFQLDALCNLPFTATPANSAMKYALPTAKFLPRAQITAQNLGLNNKKDTPMRDLMTLPTLNTDAVAQAVPAQLPPAMRFSWEAKP